MCGVAAAWTRAPLPVERRRRALAALAHRGPDGSGERVARDGAVWLGHTRLAIIAPEDGRQPLTSEDGRVHAVVNGEIYGYAALRRELEDAGHRFATGSDSEVLLHLYEERGLDFVKELRGELAFVLFDERRRRLVAGRDRFGVKPLSYATNDQGIFLASEAKALFALGVPAEWDGEAFLSACTHQYLPADRTLFAGVSQVPPGHLLICDEGGAPRLARYWDLDLPLADEELRDAPADVGEVRASIEDAVKARLRADVPIAFALSGGLDSTMVSAIAARHLGREIHTFGVAFDHPPYDERAAALRAAAHVGAVHHRVQVSQDDLVDALPDAVAHGEGLAINGQLPAKLLLSRAIREAGFSVVLTGEGADELFYGYSHLLADLAATLPDDEAGRALRVRLAGGHDASRGVMLPRDDDAIDPLLAPVSARLGRAPAFLRAKVAFGRRMRSLLEPSAGSDPAARARLASLIDAQDVAGQLAGRHPVAQSAYLWSRLALSGYILKTLGDGTEMASSVEGRPPFLDHHLAAVAQRLPLGAKIRDGVEKHVLREAARDLVPEETRTREKHPFLAPPLTLHASARGRELVGDILRSTAIADVPFVDESRVVAFLDGLEGAPEQTRRDAEPVLFTLLTASLLSRRFGMRRVR